jgi:hypothetical protein
MKIAFSPLGGELRFVFIREISVLFYMDNSYIVTYMYLLVVQVVYDVCQRCRTEHAQFGTVGQQFGYQITGDGDLEGEQVDLGGVIFYDILSTNYDICAKSVVQDIIDRN